MIIRNFNTNDKVLIIAEVGNNHEGSYALAEEMIGQAAEAGADAVKFQTIVPSKLVSIKQTERIKQLSKFQLSNKDFINLADVAKKQNIIFLSTPFDIESAIFLNDFVPAFKIASGDNNFFPLIKSVAKTGKPIIMSTGLMSFDEVEKSTLFIKDIWKKNYIKQELALLHCVSSYPTLPEEVNLLAIKKLKKLSNIIGYSDHTLGIEAAILSVGLGARIVEKHFTVDNNYSDFRDHRLSVNPVDLKEMVDRIRIVEKMLGHGEKIPTDSELKNKKNSRRSIIANKSLNPMHVVKLEDLDWVRPGDGIEVGDEEKVLNKKLIQKMNIGEKFKLKNLL